MALDRVAGRWGKRPVHQFEDLSLRMFGLACHSPCFPESPLDWHAAEDHALPAATVPLRNWSAEVIPRSDSHFNSLTFSRRARWYTRSSVMPYLSATCLAPTPLIMYSFTITLSF